MSRFSSTLGADLESIWKVLATLIKMARKNSHEDMRNKKKSFRRSITVFSWLTFAFKNEKCEIQPREHIC